MATIPGGLTQESFFSIFTDAGSNTVVGSASTLLGSLSSGLLPTNPTAATLDQLNPVSQLFVGQAYGLYTSLGGNSPTGLVGDNMTTFQAFAQFYSTLDVMVFGPYFGLFNPGS